MKIKIAITRVEKTAAGEAYQVVSATPEMGNYSLSVTVMDSASLCSSLLQTPDCLPVNFSIEAVPKGNQVVSTIKDNVGKFDRFAPLAQNLPVYVVLDEICSKGGRIMGYTLLNVLSMQVEKIQKSVIVESAEQSTYPLLQNAIISNGGVRSYEGHPFEQVIIGSEKPRVERHLKAAREQLTGVPVPPVKSEEQHKPKPGLGTFTMMEKARKNGLPVDDLEKKGFSYDIIRFYCANVTTKELAEDCKPIFNNPKLNRDQVQTLFKGVVEGAYIDDLCDENMNAPTMEAYIAGDLAELWNELNRTVLPKGERDDVATKSLKKELARINARKKLRAKAHGRD